MENFRYKTGQVTPEHKWTELPGELSTSGVSTSDETRIAQGKAVKVAGQGAGQGAGHTTNATPSLTAGKQLCVDNSSRVPRKLAVKTAAKVAPKNFTKPGKKIDSKMPREPRSQSISATCRVVVTPSNRPPSTINNPVATGQQTSNRQARNCANRQIVAQTKAGNHEPISAPHQQVKSTTNGAHNGPPPPRSVAGDRGETVMIHLSPRVMRSVAAATAKVVPIRRCQSACRKTEARSGTPAKKNSAVATPRHPVTMATESMVAPPGGGDVVTCSRRDQHPTLANAQVEGRLSDNRVCRRTQMQAGDAEMHSWGHNSTENKSTLATKTDAKEYQFRCQQTTKEHELSRTSTQQPQRRQHRQTGEATDSRMSTCSDSDDNLPTHLQLLQESRARKCEIDAEISQFNRVEVREISRDLEYDSSDYE